MCSSDLQEPSSLPEGTSVSELGSCDHALRFPGCNYEVGVVARQGGYILRWDYFRPGGLARFLGGMQAPKLVQAYGVEKAKLEVMRKGYRVTESVLQDGSIRLHCQGAY